jgi:hypothetical protein
VKVYLGDGVYAEFDRGEIVLTTENGIEVTNRIVLEPEVLAMFGLWVRKSLPSEFSLLLNGEMSH